MRNLTEDSIRSGGPTNGKSDATGIEPHAWPQLQAEAMPGFVGDLVRAATTNSEADPAAITATLLAHAGVVVGRNPAVRVGDDLHHARLFCVIAGQSARGRKGTSEAPIRRIWEQAERIRGPLQWVPGPMSSGEGLVFAIRDSDGKPDGDQGVFDKRLFIVEGEFAAPLRAMQRQGNTLSTIIRVAWDGKTIAPLTKTHAIKASNPHIGIVAHITKDELRSLLGNVEIFNGFANRFLWWGARRQKLVPLAQGMTDADVTRLGHEYAARLEAARNFSIVQFDRDAKELYCQLYADLTEDRGGLYGVVTARAEAQVIRLALTYALLDASPVIKVDHVLAAVAAWDYCDATAKFLFGDARPDPIEQRIMLALGDGRKTSTELNKALGGHTSADAIRSALERLQGVGRIDRSDKPTAGRPLVTWHLRNVRQGAEQAEKAEKV